jgi:uncharacterized protein (DUF2267 family)
MRGIQRRIETETGDHVANQLPVMAGVQVMTLKETRRTAQKSRSHPARKLHRFERLPAKPSAQSTGGSVSSWSMYRASVISTQGRR